MTIPSAPRCFALVPCAGIGVRAGAGGPKQYAALAGQAMVAHTLAALARVRRIEATLVVLAPDDAVFERHAPRFGGERGWVARCGGATRAATVASGLAALRDRGARADDWVLVHDAARCLIAPAAVDRLIDACLPDVVGGLLAVPVSDTLKRGVDGRVGGTLPRAGAWAAQTPQMFRIGTLQQALAQSGDVVTDESSAIESLGLAPLLVQGDPDNLKLTWPADFVVAEALLAARTET